MYALDEIKLSYAEAVQIDPKPSNLSKQRSNETPSVKVKSKFNPRLITNITPSPILNSRTINPKNQILNSRTTNQTSWKLDPKSSNVNKKYTDTYSIKVKSKFNPKLITNLTPNKSYSQHLLNNHHGISNYSQKNVSLQSPILNSRTAIIYSPILNSRTTNSQRGISTNHITNMNYSNINSQSKILNSR